MKEITSNIVSIFQKQKLFYSFLIFTLVLSSCRKPKDTSGSPATGGQTPTTTPTPPTPPTPTPPPVEPQDLEARISASCPNATLYVESCEAGANLLVEVSDATSGNQLQASQSIGSCYNGIFTYIFPYDLPTGSYDVELCQVVAGQNDCMTLSQTVNAIPANPVTINFSNSSPVVGQTVTVSGNCDSDLSNLDVYINGTLDSAINVSCVNDQYSFGYTPNDANNVAIKILQDNGSCLEGCDAEDEINPFVPGLNLNVVASCPDVTLSGQCHEGSDMSLEIQDANGNVLQASQAITSCSNGTLSHNVNLQFTLGNFVYEVCQTVNGISQCTTLNHSMAPSAASPAVTVTSSNPNPIVGDTVTLSGTCDSSAGNMSISVNGSVDSSINVSCVNDQYSFTYTVSANSNIEVAQASSSCIQASQATIALNPGSPNINLNLAASCPDVNASINCYENAALTFEIQDANGAVLQAAQSIGTCSSGSASHQVSNTQYTVGSFVYKVCQMVNGQQYCSTSNHNMSLGNSSPGVTVTSSNPSPTIGDTVTLSGTCDSDAGNMSVAVNGTVDSSITVACTNDTYSFTYIVSADSNLTVTQADGSCVTGSDAEISLTPTAPPVGLTLAATCPNVNAAITCYDDAALTFEIQDANGAVLQAAQSVGTCSAGTATHQVTDTQYTVGSFIYKVCQTVNGQQYCSTSNHNMSLGNSSPGVTVTSSNPSPTIGDTVTLSGTCDSDAGNMSVAVNGTVDSSITVACTNDTYSFTYIVSADSNLTVTQADGTCVKGSDAEISLTPTAPPVGLTLAATCPNVNAAITCYDDAALTFEIQDANGAVLQAAQSIGTCSSGSASHQVSNTQYTVGSFIYKVCQMVNGQQYCSTSNHNMSLGNSNPGVTVTSSNTTPNIGDTVTLSGACDSDAGNMSVAVNGTVDSSITVACTNDAYTFDYVVSENSSLLVTQADGGCVKGSEGSLEITVGKPVIVVNETCPRTVTLPCPKDGDNALLTITSNDANNPVVHVDAFSIPSPASCPLGSTFTYALDSNSSTSDYLFGDFKFFACYNSGNLCTDPVNNNQTQQTSTITLNTANTPQSNTAFSTSGTCDASVNYVSSVEAFLNLADGTQQSLGQFPCVSGVYNVQATIPNISNGQSVSVVQTAESQCYANSSVNIGFQNNMTLNFKLSCGKCSTNECYRDDMKNGNYEAFFRDVDGLWKPVPVLSAPGTLATQNTINFDGGSIPNDGVYQMEICSKTCTATPSGYCQYGYNGDGIGRACDNGKQRLGSFFLKKENGSLIMRSNRIGANYIKMNLFAADNMSSWVPDSPFNNIDYTGGYSVLPDLNMRVGSVPYGQADTIKLLYGAYEKACYDIAHFRSPLMIQLNSETPLDMTSQKDGMSFDIDGDGLKDKISCPKSEDYVFLTLPDANGKVNNVNQLFGNLTVGPDGKRSDNGFYALAKYDKDENNVSDGIIDSKDVVFSQLRLWSEKNCNGEVDEGELFTLSEKGLSVIKLDFDENYDETKYNLTGEKIYPADQWGNQTRQQSTVYGADAEDKRMIFDIWFSLYPSIEAYEQIENEVYQEANQEAEQQSGL